jgi:NTP pyrophosphatase (non-canonical NTP hydrolase)
MPTPDSIHDELAAFVAERDWAQFHTPENLAKSIAIEAGELLECYQWSTEAAGADAGAGADADADAGAGAYADADAGADDQQVRDELADVLTYCYHLAARLGATPDELIRAKLAKTRDKYPVEKSRGRITKYDQL